jgi:SAM-dependent methyltransferase
MTTDPSTIASYDNNALQFHEYFAGFSMSNDIEKGLEYAGLQSGQGKVVEIGCGDGRDAQVIIPKVYEYYGFDPAPKLLDIARHTSPNANFSVSDALSYAYPEDIDFVYAAASLLHLNKEDLAGVFSSLSDKMRAGGVLLATFKESKEYIEVEKNDEFGKRLFYHYSVNDILECAGDKFELIDENHILIGSTPWLTVFIKLL